LISLGPEKIVCYIRYFVISDLFMGIFTGKVALLVSKGSKIESNAP